MIENLSVITHGWGLFFFFLASGYLSTQFPFGWVLIVAALFVSRGVPVSIHPLIDSWLAHPAGCIIAVVTLSILCVLWIKFLDVFPSWFVVPSFIGWGLFYLVGIVFSSYLTFKMTSGFVVNMGYAPLGFVLGFVLGLVFLVALKTIALLSAMSSTYQPQLILVLFAIGLCIAAAVTAGVYCLLFVPKAGYVMIGIGVCVLLLLFMWFMRALFNARWT